MSGAGLEITITVDDKEVKAALARLASRAERLGPALKNIGEELLQSTQDRFRSETDPEGNRWQALKASTLARKIQSGHSLKILRQCGYLADSIRYQAEAGRVVVGTNRIYGAIHQLGGKTRAHIIRPRNAKALAWPGARHPMRSVRHPGSDIPARPFLGISSQDRERILEIVEDYLRV